MVLQCPILLSYPVNLFVSILPQPSDYGHMPLGVASTDDHLFMQRLCVDQASLELVIVLPPDLECSIDGS